MSFHGLLDYDSLVDVFSDLLTYARRVTGTVDAIIAHWDFPMIVLTSRLVAERGIASPAFRSVLASEHAKSHRSNQKVERPRSGCRRTCHAVFAHRMDFGGPTPQVLALAIIAEVFAVTNGQDGGRLRDGDGAIHSNTHDVAGTC